MISLVSRGFGHRPIATGAFGGGASIFCAPINFVVVVSRKNCFTQIIETKIVPLKNVISPQTLKPGERVVRTVSTLVGRSVSNVH